MKVINNGQGEQDGYNRIEESSTESTEELGRHYKEILTLLGEDVNR